MQITPLNFYDKTFQGKYVFKIPSQKVADLCELESAYDTLIHRMAKQNGPMRTKFRSLFPGLYTGTRMKGVQLFASDKPEKSQFHLYKFSQNSPLTMRVFEGEEKEFLFSCSLDNESESLIVETTEEYDVTLAKNKFNIMEKVKEYSNQMMREFHLLLDYSEFYLKINKFLSPLSTKTEIAKLIATEKNKQGADNSLKIASNELLELFKVIKEKLDYKKSAFQIKKAYYEDGQRIEPKGLRFYAEDNSSVVYTPLQSAEDNRVYRLQRFNANNDLQKSLIAFEDGTFATIRDYKKPNDIRSGNLEKLTPQDLRDFDVKFELEFMTEHFNKFLEFVKDYIGSHKFAVVEGKYEVKDTAEYLAEKETKRLEREKVKRLLQQKKALEKLNIREVKQRRRAEERARISMEKAERISILRKQKEEQKTLKEKAKVQKVKAQKPVVEKPIVFTKQILQDTVNKLQEIMRQPVELRDARFSHERLKDGRIFAGKIFVKTKDGTKISATRVKSPRYVDFEYYSIKVEKGDKTAVMNIDSLDGEIILSTPEGKPMLEKGRINYLPMSSYAKQDEFSAKMPYYLSQLFTGEVEKGKVINSDLKLKKMITPDDILNAELPPLDNCQF